MYGPNQKRGNHKKRPMGVSILRTSKGHRERQAVTQQAMTCVFTREIKPASPSYIRICEPVVPITLIHSGWLTCAHVGAQEGERRVPNSFPHYVPASKADCPGAPSALTRTRRTGMGGACLGRSNRVLLGRSRPAQVLEQHQQVLVDVGHTLECSLHQGAPPDVVKVPLLGLGHAGGLGGQVVVLVGNVHHLYCTSVVLKVAGLSGYVGLVGRGPWVLKVRG